MKVKITLRKWRLFDRARRTVLNRDSFSCSSSGGEQFFGFGRTCSGRTIQVTIIDRDFDLDGEGIAYINIEAPGSKGGLLDTVLEECLGPHMQIEKALPPAEVIVEDDEGKEIIGGFSWDEGVKRWEWRQG